MCFNSHPEGVRTRGRVSWAGRAPRRGAEPRRARLQPRDRRGHGRHADPRVSLAGDESGSARRQGDNRGHSFFGVIHPGLPGPGTVSLPFEAGAHKRVAVKIVDDRGIESLKIIPVA